MSASTYKVDANQWFGIVFYARLTFFCQNSEPYVLQTTLKACSRGICDVLAYLHLDVLSKPLLHSHGHPLLLLLDQLLLLEQLLLLDQLLLLLLDQLLFGMPPLLNFF